jgi:hypothetical protein
MAESKNLKTQTISVTDKEIEDFKKFTLTKEYLRRALLKLQKATNYFDLEINDVEEEEESITKFISEVKRKNLV